MASAKKTSNEEVKDVANATEVESNANVKIDALKEKASLLLGKRFFGLTVKQIILILLAVIVVFLIVRGIVKSTSADAKIPDYSIVYTNDDGDLMVVSPNGKKQVKLANDAYSDVEYANKTERYILFTKDDSLYLYDKKDGEDTTKIAKDVSDTFGFSTDDKYVYYLNEDDELYSYKKESVKLDNDVDYVLKVTDDKIFYVKEDELYFRNLKGKSDKVKVASELDNYYISKDGSKILYITEDDELYSYKVSNKKAKKIDEDVKSILSRNEDLSKAIYQNADGELFSLKNTKYEKMVSDVDSVYYVDALENQVVYGYDDTLYYQKGTKKAIKVGDSEDVKKAYIYNKNQLYYTVSEDEGYELYYSKLSGSKASDPKSVASDVSSSIISTYEKGLIIFTDVEDEIGEMSIVKKGKVTKIAEDVSLYNYNISNDKNRIYFLGDCDSEDEVGTLMYTKGKKAKKVLEDVSGYQYVKNDLIYLATGYSSKSNKFDLQVYNGRKAKKIAENVTNVYDITTDLLN